MSNPRRRRTVIVAATAIFVLIVQLPNMLNVFGISGVQELRRVAPKLTEDMAGLDRALQHTKSMRLSTPPTAGGAGPSARLP